MARAGQRRIAFVSPLPQGHLFHHFYCSATPYSRLRSIGSETGIPAVRWCSALHSSSILLRPGLSSLAGFLVFLALVFSWRFVDSGANHYHPLMLVFLAAMDGFVLTGDLFNMFVFFELMSTAAFALCGLKTQEPAPLQGSFNFAVTNTIAAFLGLTGIALLYAVTGALNMAQIGLSLGSPP